MNWSQPASPIRHNNEEDDTGEEPENLDPDSDKTENDILDEMTGQMKLF